MPRRSADGHIDAKSAINGGLTSTSSSPGLLSPRGGSTANTPVVFPDFDLRTLRAGKSLMTASYVQTPALCAYDRIREIYTRRTRRHTGTRVPI